MLGGLLRGIGASRWDPATARSRGQTSAAGAARDEAHHSARGSQAPPVIDQLYVVSFGPAGTEVTLPVELSSTVAGAVILTVPVLEETVTQTGADVAVQPYASTTLTE